MRLLALIVAAGVGSPANAQEGAAAAAAAPSPVEPEASPEAEVEVSPEAEVEASPEAEVEASPEAPAEVVPGAASAPPASALSSPAATENSPEDDAAPGAPPAPAPGRSGDLPSPAAEPAPAPAASPSPDEAAVAALVTLRDQGIHYFREGLMRPAEESLTRAAKLKGGSEDFATHLYLARVQHGLDDIEQAHLEAQRALDLARKPEEVAAAKELLDGLRGFYGEVNFLSAGPDAGPRRGFVILESSTQFISPKKKQAFAKLRAERLDSVTTLPLAAYLPRGDYTANGVPFSVVEGDTTEVFLGLKSSPDAGAFPWAWVVGGSAAAAAGIVAVFLLAPEPVAKRSLRVEGTF